jgi:hypothetical protein
VPKPAAKIPTADRGPLAFEEAQHRRPLDFWVDERQQLVHVARLPGEIDASDQLDSLRFHPQQCPVSSCGTPTGGEAELGHTEAGLALAINSQALRRDEHD